MTDKPSSIPTQKSPAADWGESIITVLALAGIAYGFQSVQDSQRLETAKALPKEKLQ